MRGSSPYALTRSCSICLSVVQIVRAADAPIRVHPPRVGRDVSLGNEARDADVDRRSQAPRRSIVLQIAHRLLQQLAVQLVADRRDVAGLLRPEDVARAADLQVAHGDLEARARARELLDRLEPLQRRLARSCRSRRSSR